VSSEGRPAKWSCEQEADRKCASPDASEWIVVDERADFDPASLIRKITDVDKDSKGVWLVGMTGPGVKYEVKAEDPTKAKRFNKGKPEWARLQWTEIEEVVKVLTKSAHEKYYDDPAPEGSRGKPNWSKGNSYSMFWESAQRHLKSWIQGERYDAESGLPTLAHCIASCLILMNWERRGVGTDDRALSRGDEG
jgi:hypothetical protein